MSAVESAVAESTSKDVAILAPAALAQLPIPQRVTLLLRSEETEKELIELAGKHKDITTITNKDGREQVHRAYMVLKNKRIEIEKHAEGVREDAVKFGKAVVTEQKRLVAIISPEEERLLAVRTEWDDAEERKRQEELERERQRVAAIEARIVGFRGLVLQAAGKAASAIEALIAQLEAEPLTEAVFAERLELAEAAHAEVLAELRRQHTERVEFEAEQLRLAEERMRLEEQRRKDEEAAAARQREEDERRRQEDARLEQERAFTAADARISETARAALAATDAGVAEALLNQLLCMVFDPGTYGQRARDLEEIVTQERDRIVDHVQQLQAMAEAEKALLTPPPTAADELTAAPSPEGAESATAAAGTDVEVPYPGHEQIEQAVAAQFGVNHLQARLWLQVYAEANLPDQPAL